MSIFEASLLFLLLGLAWARSPTQYLNNLTVPHILDVKICPSDVSSRSGSFAFKSPHEEPFNMINIQTPIAVTLAIDDTPDCLLPENRQFAFFLSFRSFQLNQDKEPVYHLEIDEPSDEGRKMKAPNMALIDYTLPQFQSSPRSEIQYLSAMALKPSVTLIIHLNRLDLTNIDWETIVIDYLLIADKTSTADAGQLIYCPTLKSYVAADLYCLTPSSLTVCPKNCSGISGFDSAVSRFDTNFFSYGSCGRERVSVKCGQTKEALHGRQTVNFILDWNVLGGILAGSVVLFILFPITILCVGYYRRKR